MDGNKKITKIISILWDTPSLAYKKKWKATDKKGALFSNWFSTFCKQHPDKINILCHSMGHRFFEGIISEMNFIDFNKIIFAAPDINSDFFDVHLDKFKNNVQQIIVYKHLKDRLLKLSKKLLKTGRMGYNGIHNFEKITELLPIEVRDISETKSDRLLDLTNHIYFKTNAAVRQDIGQILE